MRYVLDTYAFLAYVQHEPSEHHIRSILRDAFLGTAEVHMSVINVGEVYYMRVRQKSDAAADSALRLVRRLRINIEAATTDRVMRAARLKSTARMSYADAFAGTLAEELDATLVTGDAEFKPLESRINILWI